MQKDFYPLVVSLGKGLSNSFRKRKCMSNYSCSVVHVDSNPVGNQILFFPPKKLFHPTVGLMEIYVCIPGTSAAAHLIFVLLMFFGVIFPCIKSPLSYRIY